MIRVTGTTDAPSVTVVICTRNRGDKVVTAIKTILLNDYSFLELIVVDQSENDLTNGSLQPFLRNPRIRYIRTATKGLSIALNLAISRARSEYIATTDDDCEVSKTWLRELVAAFAIDRRIGIVFGNVSPGPHDSRAGFVPGSVRDEPFLARSITDKRRVGGASACMGLRRTTWHALGGFDEMLGGGAPLKAAGVTDLTIRALLAGYFIYQTPRVAVIHHGFFRWDQRQTLIHHYWYGTGAALAKQVKCAQWSVAQLLFSLAWQWAFGRSRLVDSLGSRSHRLLRLAAFVQGFAVGTFTPVDRTTGHYRRQREKEPDSES